MPKQLNSTLKIQSGDEKKSQGSYINEERDRISDLPDSILSHILGKLPTKYAVGTAMLSTRWKHLFAEIPNLEIHIEDSDFLIPDLMSRDRFNLKNNYRREVNFITFMNYLFDITLRDVPQIKKFHLDLSKDYMWSISEWISAALRLNVSYLWVFSPASVWAAPESLFQSTSVVEIMLNWNGIIAVPDSVCLPNLKRMYLKDISFHGNELETVLNGCHVLEELSLRSCAFNISVDVLRISSPSIKSFQWRKCFRFETYGIELDMPALNSLCYEDYIPEYFVLKNLSAVRKAHINSGFSLEQYRRLGSVRCLRILADLVAGCSNAEFLSLASLCLAAISVSVPLPGPFYNLIELELHSTSSYGWKHLPFLLNNAPNLEVLVFTERFTDHKGCYEVFASQETEHLPKPVALNFRKIKFEKFSGKVDEIRLINFFLTNCETLTKIETSIPMVLSPDKLLKAKSKVLDLQRRSTNCQIDLILTEDGYEEDHSSAISKSE